MRLGGVPMIGWGACSLVRQGGQLACPCPGIEPTGCQWGKALQSCSLRRLLRCAVRSRGSQRTLVCTTFAMTGPLFPGLCVQAPGRLLVPTDVGPGLVGRHAELFWPDSNQWFPIVVQARDTYLGLPLPAPAALPWQEAAC